MTHAVASGGHRLGQGRLLDGRGDAHFRDIGHRQFGYVGRDQQLLVQDADERVRIDGQQVGRDVGFGERMLLRDSDDVDEGGHEGIGVEVQRGAVCGLDRADEVGRRVRNAVAVQRCGTEGDLAGFAVQHGGTDGLELFAIADDAHGQADVGLMHEDICGNAVNLECGRACACRSRAHQCGNRHTCQSEMFHLSFPFVWILKNNHLCRSIGSLFSKACGI